MLDHTFSVLVHAQMETIWNLLLERVTNPKRIMPGATEVAVVESFASGLVRDIRVYGTTYRELITINEAERWISFDILNHPALTGTLVTRILSTSVQSPVAPHHLQYQVHLERKSFHAEKFLQTEQGLLGEVEKELELIKEKAEALEREEEEHRIPPTPTAHP